MVVIDGVTGATSVLPDELVERLDHSPNFWRYLSADSAVRVYILARCTNQLVAKHAPSTMVHHARGCHDFFKVNPIRALCATHDS